MPVKLGHACKDAGVYVHEWTSSMSLTMLRIRVSPCFSAAARRDITSKLEWHAQDARSGAIPISGHETQLTSLALMQQEQGISQEYYKKSRTIFGVVM